MKVKFIFYRLLQFILSKVQPIIPWRMPELISKEGSIYILPKYLKMEGFKKVLIITTEGFIKRGTLNGLFEKIHNAKIEYVIFNDVKPDPTIECIEEAVKVYRREDCEGIIAIGGGSVMDAAKIVGARIVKPRQSVKEMTGLFKIRKKLPPLYLVPTTAGTGSEVTVAAVITDSSNHYKYPISDTCLLPKFAVLDPILTLGLPKNLTASTGMDALTHAVEAYINKFASKQSKKYAKDAIKIIFDNLIKAYNNGEDIEAREQMLLASYYAGAAFTKAYVGYVHAIAHGIGGLYGVPHGRANAIILPVVLKAYGKAIFKELAELADLVAITGKSDEEKANKFIDAIVTMNIKMDIPNKLGVIREKDIPEIIKRALKEANPAYPVPVIWDYNKLEAVLEKL